MIGRGLSERRALVVLRMSASAYRYQRAPDRNVELRERILALAQRYKRYGVGMIYLKLRQAGLLVNYKRVERLYQEAKLQVRRRKRKKVPAGDRQPLLRPERANQVWSMRKLPRQADISKVEPSAAWRYSAGVMSPSESWGRSSLYSSIHQYAASRTSSRQANRCRSSTSSRKVRLKRSM